MCSKMFCTNLYNPDTETKCTLSKERIIIRNTGKYCAMKSKKSGKSYIPTPQKAHVSFFFYKFKKNEQSSLPVSSVV